MIIYNKIFYKNIIYFRKVKILILKCLSNSLKYNLIIYIDLNTWNNEFY